jgi:hypothetical protein
MMRSLVDGSLWSIFFIKMKTDVIRYCKEKGVKMDIVKQLTSMIDKEDLEET